MAQKPEHLELGSLIDIIDLLKRCGFPESRWYELGLRLGLLKNTLDAIEKNHPRDVSRCLTECLSQWLCRGDNVDSRGGATWDSLSDAIRLMNDNAVADRLDKEKCPHRFALAVSIFDNHHPTLSQSLSDPLNTAFMLQRESVITQDVLGSVVSASPSVPKQRDILLTAVREAVQNKYTLLQTFASVLCNITGNVQLGADIQRDYGKYFNNDNENLVKVTISDDTSTDTASTRTITPSPSPLSSPTTAQTVEIAVPESMSDEFASIQTSFGRMLYNIHKIIKKEPPPLDDIKEFLCCYKSSLKSHLSSCSDISEVLQVIEKECSLINIRLLQSAVKEFRFKEAEKFINEYKGILKKFCRSVSLTLCLNEKFASGGTPLLQCEMATYVFDWEPDEHTLKDIRRIMSKSSGKLVQIKFIKRGNSIIVTCSFPYSLTGSLIIKVMENLDMLIKNGLMKLTIGYCTVWNKQEIQPLAKQEEEIKESHSKMQVTKAVVQSCSEILSHDTEVTIVRSMIRKKEETNNLFEDKIRKLNMEHYYKHGLSSTDTNLSIISKMITTMKMQQKDLLTTINTMKTDAKLLDEKEMIQKRISFLSLQLLNKETEKEKLCQEIKLKQSAIDEPSMEVDLLDQKCKDAFRSGDHAEAIRLLPLVKKPHQIRDWYSNDTLLHLSSRYGWLDVTKDLITNYHFDPQERPFHGETCLHYAAEGNHVDVVRYLITECNCDPMTVINDDGDTVLHYAAKKGLLDLLKFMINHHNCNLKATNKRGETILHCAVEHIEVVKYLIIECNCDPMVVDKFGETPLHIATYQCCSATVEYLLSTGRCDPLVKDYEGRTPVQIAEGIADILSIFKKFGQIKVSHPIDSYVNVLLLGNPGAGKSTLRHVIINTATGSIAFGSFRNVKGVKPFTAGIIPVRLQHKTLGSIILHDFAGHSEFYSSHSAVIENLLKGSGGVFLIVVNILEKEVVKQLRQWLTVVRNEAEKAFDQCHVIVVVSHVDEKSNPVERRVKEEEIQEIIASERLKGVFLDCRKLGGSGIGTVFKMLSSACESIRSTSGRNLSLYCHMMYGLLEERKENVLIFSDVMSDTKDSYVLPKEREELFKILHSLDSTGLINVLQSEDKVWVVVNKGILLTELDGILFAPKDFKEHVDIASNTGIVSVSDLASLFPHYDPDMLICFLKKMELCQEMNPSFISMTNLIPSAIEGSEEERDTTRRGERLLFFPCLLYSNRPDQVTSKVYQFGWRLQCTGEHHFFPPRYFHVLSLHLAYKFALPKRNEKLNRYCTFWRNGLHWFDGHSVGVLVEIVDESQCVLVLMSCEEGYSDNMVRLRKEVIQEVVSVYSESCPSLKVEEFLIDPQDLAYHVKTLRERRVYSGPQEPQQGLQKDESLQERRRRSAWKDTGRSKSLYPDEQEEALKEEQLRLARIKAGRSQSSFAKINPMTNF